MFALGQWKVKFSPKPGKGLFSKLNGDLVKVPILHHQNYMTVMTLVVELKAQVKNINTCTQKSIIHTGW